MTATAVRSSSDVHYARGPARFGDQVDGAAPDHLS
jgi:hypothetical protein